MPPEAVLLALRHVWMTLDAMHIPMALMGGLAMSAWKHPRFTRDVDLIIGVYEPESPAIIKQLVKVGVTSQRRDPMVRIDDIRFLQLSYQPPETFVEVQIDLLLATSDFYRQAIERRVPLPAAELGFEVAVVSCEDLILLKLNAGRILDRVDVGELLKIHRAALDFQHLAQWLPRLRLRHAFREAWKDAFGDESSPI
jgi:Nucleotidyl transferase AbiEii toxin, Type IV TA system